MTAKHTVLPLAALLVSGVAPAQNKQKPNLVFVLIDDFGWGGFALNKSMYDYSQLNQEFIKLRVTDYTPEQAQAAAELAIPTLSQLCLGGTRFTNAYTSANVSSPSRAGIMTSRYQERFGYYINGEQVGRGVPLTETFMPKYIHDVGYATACIGKFHLSPNVKDDEGGCADGYNPLDRGFDYYWGFNAAGTDYYGSKILHKGREKVAATGYSTDEFTREAVDFISRSQGKPFMIYLAYNAVHGPLGLPAPPQYLDRFKYDSRLLNNFYAYLYAVDQGVARIIDKLRETGQLDNTMIVFTSDNGAPGGAADVLPKNGPLRGFKGQTWQGGIRVPMFFYVPGQKGGLVSDNIVSNMDIFPTFMDWAGIPLPKNIDGKSLLPIISGKSTAPVRDELVWMGQMAENWGMYGIRDQKVAPGGFMVRKGDRVLRYDIVARQFTLYDLTNDIGEKNDISAAEPAKVEEMKAIFRKWYGEMKPPMSWKPALWKGVEFWDSSSNYQPPTDANSAPREKGEKRKNRQKE